MIIKAKLLPAPFIKAAAYFLTWFFRRRFNKMVISQAEILPGHSYLLMCNHFSFWDAFWASYLCLHGIHKHQTMTGFSIMILEKQLRKNMWMRYFGCFSIAPGKASVQESLDYAAEMLNNPGHLLLMYPQGNLESCHIRHIVLKDGVKDIIGRVTGKCQLIWSSNIVEYFESLKPSVYFNMLDCGTNKDFDFNELSNMINKHHQTAIQKQIRFTDEPKGL